MARLSVLASLLLFFLVSSSATSAPLTKEFEINGVRLKYMEQGSGEPMVLVHGAFSDLRVWASMQERLAKRYRAIAFTQRYFGTDPWPDQGKNFNVSVHAEDLAKFIMALNAGP